MPKQYRPAENEPRIRMRWEADHAAAFHADPARVTKDGKQPYCIVIPPPNVTAALHLGHALNNTIQDILVRAHRMMGYETLWMPGTDHAGIATQAVVEKRLKKDGVLKGPLKTTMKREEFVAHVQAFKDEYEATITGQLKAMGCSCDWSRQRFTMDDQCARAVREAFFRLFRDGLIYRGKRLVNWDPALQTAVADDECYDEEIDGHFYYLRYPLVHKAAGKGAGAQWQPVTWDELATRGYPGAEQHPGEEPAWVTVATTRPETYLGDTAVAVNPHDPRAKSLRGLFVELPLVGRIIPILEDDYVVLPEHYARNDEEKADPKAKMATGFLKVTPAHDPNDYELGMRHEAAIEAAGNPVLVNVMAPDARISDKHGWGDVADAHIFVGLKREDARKKVVEEFKARGLMEGTKPHRHSVKHSDRSKAIVEPYLSDQWYVKVTDPRFAETANAALVSEQRTTAKQQSSKAAQSEDGDGSMRFYPARYAKTYEMWHDNIRDWCISRQLWWGHRIPVWTIAPELPNPSNGIPDFISQPDEYLAALQARLDTFAKVIGRPNSMLAMAGSWDESTRLYHICVVDPTAVRKWETAALVINQQAIHHTPGTALPAMPHFATSEEIQAALSLHRAISKVKYQDPDVLDTWFSSALWPLSTMGWPDDTELLRTFNPTDALCTAREIITLWVSRMVMFNRYFRQPAIGNRQSTEATSSTNAESRTPNAGPIPFRDVFIHAMIQDGEGRKMSKSLGNGVDPLDIIATHGADAMRFTLCHMTTQTQDVRMPVAKDSATGKNTSPKFDLGRNFANKLWNAARFAIEALGNKEPATATDKGELTLADRWMLSRLASAAADVEAALKEYQFSAYATAMYDVLWRDFCDWYLEAIKPTISSNATQRAALRTALDIIIRLLHPVMPFITEAIHERLKNSPGGIVPGVTLETTDLLCTSGWPRLAASLRDEEAERRFERVRALVEEINKVRAQHKVHERRKITLHPPTPPTGLQTSLGGDMAFVETLGKIERIDPAPPAAGGVSLRFETFELHLSNLADVSTAGSGSADGSGGGGGGVDASAERERLQRLIADNEKKIATFDGRLNNPGYIAKAPPKLVDETKAHRAKAVEELEAAKAALARLG